MCMMCEHGVVYVTKGYLFTQLLGTQLPEGLLVDGPLPSPTEKKHIASYDS